jgi:hypothetical protein
MHATYIGRAGLQRLHSPAEHLQLALGEGGRAGGGGGSRSFVAV